MSFFFLCFRIPQISTTSQGIKGSDNDDVVYIQSSEGSNNNHSNVEKEAANNPFRFGANTQNSANNVTNDIVDSKTMAKSQISQDSASITINNITDLLKQLQLLADREKEILKSKKYRLIWKI